MPILLHSVPSKLNRSRGITIHFAVPSLTKVWVAGLWGMSNTSLSKLTGGELGYRWPGILATMSSLLATCWLLDKESLVLLCSVELSSWDEISTLILYLKKKSRISNAASHSSSSLRQCAVDDPYPRLRAWQDLPRSRSSPSPRKSSKPHEQQKPWESGILSPSEE